MRQLPMSDFYQHLSDKAAASEARRLSRMDDRNSEKICFACRERGHAARDCPNAVNVEEGKSAVGICYRLAFSATCS